MPPGDCSRRDFLSQTRLVGKPRTGCAENADANVSGKPEADAGGPMNLLLALRAEQSNRIRQALAWLHRQPLARTLALRQIMEPIQNLIKTNVNQGSSWYELDQQREKLRALQAGVRVSTVVRCRRLRSESGRERIRTAMVSALWEHLIPVTSHRRAFRCCLFRMLSCSQCLAHVKLRMLHLQSQYRVITDLGGNQSVADLIAPTKCLLRDFCYRDRECVQPRKKSPHFGNS